MLQRVVNKAGVVLYRTTTTTIRHALCDHVINVNNQ